MSAGKYTIEIEQGAFWSASLTYKDKLGEPIPLTGYSARMHIRPFTESDDVMLVLSTAEGGITLGADDGIIEIEISSAQTATLTSDGVYDLELVAPSGEVKRLLKGKVKLDMEVTR